MKRLGIPVVLLVALIGFMAGSTANGKGASTLKLVAKTVSFTATTDPATGPAQADVYGYNDDLFDASGTDKLGVDQCFCVAATKDDLVCSGTLVFPDGQLTFTQPFSNATLTGIGAITGGTGKYAGATGTFEATGRAGTDPQVYDYTVRLLD